MFHHKPHWQWTVDRLHHQYHQLVHLDLQVSALGSPELRKVPVHPSRQSRDPAMDTEFHLA